jgi:hypothetical protein
MEANLGTRGATQQSWQRNISIRIYIKEIQDAHPRANKDRLVRLLADKMREDDDALMSAAEYAIDNAVSAQRGYVARSEPRPQPIARVTSTPEEIQKRREAEKAQAAEIVERILYLNMEMPNGKRLRFCPGNYVAKVCAPLAKLGKSAGTKLMGQAYSEEDIRKAIG